MRKHNYIFFLFLTLFNKFCYSQDIFNYNFDTDTNFVEFDTSANNIWQVGTPSKPFFDTAYSGLRALTTDSVNSYPSSNISQVIVPIDIVYGATGTKVSFQHKMNTRPNQDGGYVEISVDSGMTWAPLNDSVYFGNYTLGSPYSVNLYGITSLINFPQYNSQRKDTLYNGKIGFTGNFWWTESSIRFWCFAVKKEYRLWLKFTFESDTGQTNFDGWMIDDIKSEGIGGICSGLEDENDLNVSIHPNPTTNNIFIEIEEPSESKILNIYNTFGQLQYKQVLDRHKTDINTSLWHSGVYFYNIAQDEGHFTSGKIVIEK